MTLHHQGGVFEYNEELANTIAQVVMEELDRPTKLNGKSLVHFRNAMPRKNEYSIVASIVGYKTVPKHRNHNDLKRQKAPHYDCQLITLCSGVKAIPSVKITHNSRGRLVHDMHAEVLAMRLFNYVILKDIGNSGGKLVEKGFNGKYQLQDKDLKFALYISDIPCGDASMGNTRALQKDEDDWEQKPGNNIVRGRSFFGEVGKVRTKPGRGDSLISYSKSCSDKICMEQFCTLLNSCTYNLIDDEHKSEFFLQYLVLPKDKIHKNDIERCFCGRFHKRIGKLLQKSYSPIKVIGTDKKCLKWQLELSDLHKEIQSSPLSLLYSPILENYAQVLNKGVRNGCSSKGAIKRGSRSDICRENLLETVKLINPKDVDKFHSYDDFKNGVKGLRTIRGAVKELLGNWEPSTKDNFVF